MKVNVPSRISAAPFLISNTGPRKFLTVAAVRFLPPSVSVTVFPVGTVTVSSSAKLRVAVMTSPFSALLIAV